MKIIFKRVSEVMENTALLDSGNVDSFAINNVNPIDRVDMAMLSNCMSINDFDYYFEVGTDFIIAKKCDEDRSRKNMFHFTTLIFEELF